MSDPSSSRAVPARGRSPWLFAAKLAIYALVIAYFAKLTAELDWASLWRVALDPVWLGALLGFGWLHRLLMVTTWAGLVTAFGGHCDRWLSFNYLSARSWLGRYLPGKVALVLGRAQMAPLLGVPALRLGALALVESALHLGIASLVGLILLGRSGDMLGRFARGHGPWLIAGVVALGALVPLALSRLGPTLRARLASLRGEVAPRPLPLMLALLAAMSASAVGGLLCVSAQAAVDGVAHWSHFVVSWASLSLASAAGILAFLVPGGLGVREAALVPLLARLSSLESALVVVVLLRAAELLTDLSYLALSQLALRLGGEGTRGSEA